MGTWVHECDRGIILIKDIEWLKDRVHIIDGTQKRIHDLMKKNFNTEYLNLFFIKKADKILSRGFKQ